MQDEYFMRHALECAQQANSAGEVPVGAVIVQHNVIIAKGWNQPIALHDPTAHAEIVTLRSAAMALKNYRIPGVTLYVTLEPCLMCIGAMIQARIERLVFGAFDPKVGAVSNPLALLPSSHFNHCIQHTGGILQAECGALLTQFFKTRRSQ